MKQNDAGSGSDGNLIHVPSETTVVKDTMARYGFELTAEQSKHYYHVWATCSNCALTSTALYVLKGLPLTDAYCPECLLPMLKRVN